MKDCGQKHMHRMEGGDHNKTNKINPEKKLYKKR
jgi:hypothetical protein